MDQQKKDNIRRLLDNIEQVDNVPPQMFRNFDDDDDDDESGDKNGRGWWEDRPRASGRGASSSATATSRSADVVDNWEDLPDDTDFSGESSQPRQQQQQQQPSGWGSSRQSSEFPQRSSAVGRGLSDKAASSSGQAFSGRPHGGRTFSDQDSGSRDPRPSTSQGLPHASSGGALGSADDDADLEEEVPQVAGLLEYNRAHADIIYVDDEMGDGECCYDLVSLFGNVVVVVGRPV